MKDIHYLDVSFPYYQGMAIYPNNPCYFCERISDIARGDACNVSKLGMGTHTGTHLDAPSHFMEDGLTIDKIPLERINGKAKVICVSDPVITVDCLSKYSIQKGDRILFKTDNTDQFLGRYILPSYTTLDYEAAQFLADREVNMVGIDYMTIERPKELRGPDKSVHRTLLGRGICILESLDLRNVKEGDYTLHCLPLKLEGCDGSPVRAVLSESME